MNEMQSFKRFPAVRCWIKHILEGRYVSNDNSYLTIFGKIKRVRIITSVIDKREIISTKESEEYPSSEDMDDAKLNLEFKLDDGTGLIRAILFHVDPDQYKGYIKGDIVDLVGRIGEWKGLPQIYPEIIKKVNEPNYILLRNAEIIKRIKFGELKQIPDIHEDDFEIDISSDEIDLNELFEGEENLEFNELKNKIYSIIKRFTKEGNGISYEELKNQIDTSEDELKTCIIDLEMESRIYQSEENIYQSY